MKSSAFHFERITIDPPEIDLTPSVTAYNHPIKFAETAKISNEAALSFICSKLNMNPEDLKARLLTENIKGAMDSGGLKIVKNKYGWWRVLNGRVVKFFDKRPKTKLPRVDEYLENSTWEKTLTERS